MGLIFSQGSLKVGERDEGDSKGGIAVEECSKRYNAVASKMETEDQLPKNVGSF